MAMAPRPQNAFSDLVPLSKEAALAEVRSTKEILSRWEKFLDEHDEEKSDYTSDELEDELRLFAGEMLLASEKLKALLAGMTFGNE